MVYAGIAVLSAICNSARMQSWMQSCMHVRYIGLPRSAVYKAGIDFCYIALKFLLQFLYSTISLHTLHTLSLSFSLQNRLCTLDQNGHSKQCGMRELNPLKGDGVIFWKPNICQFYKCQCMATKEVRREKRTIADNKTMIEQRRYRIFECV